MRYFHFIFLLSFFTLFSQNNLEISYIINYNTEIPNKKTGDLLIDLKEQKSVFYISKTNLKPGATLLDNEIKVIQKGVERYIIIDKIKDSLISKDIINNNIYLIKESVPQFKWDVQYKKTKKIGKYICNKATTQFRGRKYTAWYSMEFPIRFGPWKFNGLPGIIIEIYDETFRYHWIATKIKSSQEHLILPIADKKLKSISLKEYVDVRYNQQLEISSSRLGRETRTELIKVPRSGIEIKFEWEEETKKD